MRMETHWFFDILTNFIKFDTIHINIKFDKMTIQEKLKIIIKIAKLTQQQLANDFGVSFPTINSWINGKSAPRKKQLEKIDRLYLQTTGQNIIPATKLLGKKEYIFTKVKKLNLDIVNTLLKRQDIYEDLVLDITYHTNNIEGSTLTKAETQDILFDNNANINKPVKEILEAKNHQTAFNYLLDYLSKDKKIDEKLILKLHNILMNSILPNAGIYRYHNVRIVNSNVPTANYLSVPKLMQQLFLKINNSKSDIILESSIIHAEFEQIHPFSDGNGRIGRLLLIAQLLQNNLPPAIVRKNKHDYYAVLAKAQNFKDYSLLEEYICDAIILGLEKFL